MSSKITRICFFIVLFSNPLHAQNFEREVELENSETGLKIWPSDFDKMPLKQIILDKDLDHIVPHADLNLLNMLMQYTVKTSSNINHDTYTCENLSQQLRDAKIKLGRIDDYSEEVRNGDYLTFAEIKKVKSLVKKYEVIIKNITDRYVDLEITWKPSFKNFNGEYRLSAGKIFMRPIEFKNIHVQGPGLDWGSERTFLPSFLNVDIYQEIYIQIKYRMPIMDFCLGRNSIYLRDVLDEELRPSQMDPIFFAQWKRQIGQSDQVDYWRVIPAKDAKEYQSRLE